MKFKKLVLYDREGSDFLSQALGGFCEELVVVKSNKDFGGKIKPGDLAGADAFVAKIFENYDRDFLSKAGELKYFGLASTGYNSVEVPYLKEKGITFTNVPHYATEGVAELTFCALLVIARKMGEAIADAKKGRQDLEKYLGLELNGKTMGIIGLGSIGTRVAEIAKGFGMEVRYYSKERKPEVEARLGVRYLELDGLLKSSDVLSLHCTLNEETEGILSRERLLLLKPGTIVLNSARSELCDLGAVKELAESGRLFFWFDALYEKGEEGFDSDIPNLLATPHIGWMTEEAQQRLDEATVENVKNFLEGKATNVV